MYIEAHKAILSRVGIPFLAKQWELAEESLGVWISY